MPDFETFSTTADVGIRIKGKDSGELLRNAINGLNLLYFDSLPEAGSFHAAHEVHNFQFDGDSLENILVNFLSEAVYLLQNLERVTVEAQFAHIDERSIDANFITIPLETSPGLEIKSVTYHNLKISDSSGIKSCEIVFDI